MGLGQKFSKEFAGDLRNETARKIKEVRSRSLEEEILKRNKIEGDFSFENIKKELLNKLIKSDFDRHDQAFIEKTFKARQDFDILQIQKEYKEEFDKILSACPLSEDERAEYLMTENIEKMSLDDYLVLLKRLSGEAFYHVTQYGVRESHSLSKSPNHVDKEGRFVDNFTAILEDGKLRSFLSTIITNEEKVHRIINPILLSSLKESGSSLEEAADIIVTTYYNANHPVDKEAVHMSYDKDLQDMYGGEKGYPIYFYYPVEYILQNKYFLSHRSGEITIGAGSFKNQRNIDMPHNDFEIFNFGEGVPINAGILCIDGSAKVDPNTGSQYSLGADGRPLVDRDRNYVAAVETISAQEYWEKYFQLHPEQKPNKIMYAPFHTYAKREDQSLKDWAKTKDIFKQGGDNFKDFCKHGCNDMILLKQIIMRAIKTEFE